MRLVRRPLLGVRSLLASSTAVIARALVQRSLPVSNLLRRLPNLQTTTLIHAAGVPELNGHRYPFDSAVSGVHSCLRLGHSRENQRNRWYPFRELRAGRIYRKISKMVAVGGGDEGPTSLGLHDGLNPFQREAVCAEVGPIRVVAGPGSGKTRVLTRRITFLVRSMSVSCDGNARRSCG